MSLITSQKTIELRDYQSAALSALWRYWYDNEGTNPLIVAPTGAGKSILIAEIIRQVIKAKPDAHIMLVSHVQELLLQDMYELLDLAPDLYDKIGICSAGLEQKETHLPITFAGVQTAYKQEFPKHTLVMIDEAHRIGRNKSSMYGQLIANLKEKNSRLRICGLTATPYRLDSGKLTEGNDPLFDGIAYDIELIKLINDGYLVPPLSKHKAQMENLTIRAGEYSVDSQEFFLDQHLDDYATTVANETEEDVTLLFFPSVSMSSQFAELLKDRHINAAHIDGTMNKTDRFNIVESFKSGKITHLCNVDLMTTGSNIPTITAIVLLRATKSASLYVQMIGRGLRLHVESDKQHCKVLDFGGNALRHGPLNKPFSFERDRSRSEKPVGRECPSCAEVLPSNQRTCDMCGYVFPKIEREEGRPKTTGGSYVGDLVGYAEQPHWVSCFNIKAEPWTSKAGNNMLRVSYGLSGHTWPVSEWMNPEGLDRTLLRRKWDRRALGLDIQDPESYDIERAIEVINSLTHPSFVKIARKDDSKYYEVFDVSYDDNIAEDINDDFDF